MSSTAALTAAPFDDRGFAELELVFPERTRPAGAALADLILQLLSAQAEQRRGGVVWQGGGRLDQVSLVGTFDLEELAADLDTFFD